MALAKRWKTSAAFLLAASIILSLSACQATPEQGVVVGKNTEELIEKAAAKTSGSLAQRVNAPETVQTSFSSTSGKLHVTVDAQVYVPGAKAVPIIRVTPEIITQEQASALIRELTTGELYDPDRPLSKDEIAEMILEAKRMLSEGPSADDPLYQTEGLETWEQTKREEIDWLQEQYADVPETVNVQLMEDTFEDRSYGGTSKWIEGKVFCSDGSPAAINIVTYDAPEEGWSQAFFTRQVPDDEMPGWAWYGWSSDQYALNLNGVDISQVPDVTISEDEAKALCESVVEILDLPGMAVSYPVSKVYSMENYGHPVKCAWALRYTREVSGIPITYTSDYYGAGDASNQYAASWPHEHLDFYVNDDGIVDMYMLSPMKICDAVTEDSSLMEFDQVMDTFEKMFLISSGDQEMDLTIRSIRLGYARVLKQDEPGVGLLVPVWDFFGEGAAEGVNEMGETINYAIATPGHTFLTINAIDGSVIDRVLGY